MRWLLLVIALAAGSAWSDDPIPGNREKTAPPQKQASNTNKPTAKDYRGTEKQPLFVKVVDSPHTETNATKNENKSSDKPAFVWGMTAEEATAIFTGFLVVVGALTAAVLIGQSYLLLRSVNLARDEFISTHRPRVILRDVRIVLPEGHDEASVRYTLANIGETDAIIIKLLVSTKSGDRGELLTPPPPLADEGVEVSITLKPGGEYTTQVDSTFRQKAIQFPEHMDSRLWFMGKVIYRDTREAKRATAFCCYFNPHILRFRTLSGNEITGYEYNC